MRRVYRVPRKEPPVAVRVSQIVGGVLPDVVGPWTLAVDAATFSISGQSIVLARNVAITQADIQPAGQNIGLVYGTVIPVTQASFQIDGQTIPMNTSGVVGKADLSPTGQGILFDSLLAAGKADISPTGSSLVLDDLIAVGAASFSVVGQDVALLASSALSIAVDSATFSVAGQEVGFALTDVQEATGGWFLSFLREQEALEEEWKNELERRELEAEADRLEAHLVETGSLPKGLTPELRRIRELVRQYEGDPTLPNRAKRAFAYAEKAQNEMALRLAQRELNRLREEEEFAVLMVLALD